MNLQLFRTMVILTVALGGVDCPAQWIFRLDTTFRTSIVEQNVNSLAIMPDSRLLLSGRIKFPGDMGSPRGSAILHADGAQDLSFTDFNGGGKLTPWNSKYYVSVGQTVRRLMPNGNIDPTYIAMNLGPYFQSGSGGDYHVFPDGRVLITGNHHLSDSIRGFTGWYKLIWFSNEGYLDTTRIHRQANGPMWNFTALPDGKFLCSCSCTEYDGQPVGRVFRIHADGSLDTTFQTDINTGNIFAYHPLEDGRVLVGGNFRSAFDPDQVLQFVRFMPDGSLDPSFNNYMYFGVADGLNGVPKVTNIIPWHDDKYFVMGFFRNVDGDTRGGICVTDTSGQLLPLMDECLNGPFTYMVNTAASIHGITPTPDGTGFYINGTYAGYTDGLINDTLQRFVSRLLVEQDTTVGISTAASNTANFSLHPNPSTGLVHINFEPPTTNGVAQVRDALGRLVYVQRLSATNNTLDLRALSDGLYFVSINTHDQHLPAQRLVLQR